MPATARELFHELWMHPLSGSEAQLSTGIHVTEGSVNIFRSMEGTLGLVIPTTQQEYDHFRPDTKSHALKLTKLRADGYPHVRLSLTDPTQEKIFAVFVDEVLATLAKQPENPSATAGAMLQRWRRLFTGSQSAAGFSLEQELGLLCELEVLTVLLEKIGPSALDRWTGPESLPHDFELAGESIECKATSASSGLRVSIHGIPQLSQTPEKHLTLVVRRYIPDPDGTISIPDLCAAIYSRPDIAVDTFLEKLEKVGCPLFHDDSNSIFSRYSPAGAYEFHVEDGFPRISNIGPEQRVQQVNYVLDLSGPETVPGYQSSNRFLTDREK